MNIKHAVTSVDRDDLKMEALLFDRNCKGYSQNESKYNSRDINS
jgi:hypothetical protein